MLDEPQDYYMHHLPGRIRIRSPFLRGCFRSVTTARDHLHELPGVISSTTNVLTGSILIRYDTKITTSAPIVNKLRLLGFLPAVFGFPRHHPWLSFRQAEAPSAKS